MKNILLCALNARYSHSSLSLLCLKHAAFEPQTVRIREYNINDSVMDIAADIVARKPDAIGFSCYIWNIEYTVKIASVVKKVLPDCLIVFGGPEVSFECEMLMERWPYVDVIIRGMGELPFAHLTKCLANDESIEATPSACIRTSSGIVRTSDAPFYELDSQPFLYDDLSAFENKMIYYESSRGCPFRCAYCMSAGERLSFLPIERVKAELEYFMRANVRQIKLVDRTFNHPDARAREIFEALIALKEKYPHSVTNYHFEISASLLSEETIALLATAPKGLIQLEVGIQSTYADTLHAVNRMHNTQKLLDNTAALCRPHNLRVYVDLIAGLPKENYETFAHSFDDAYHLGADRLQLGFLKLLRGSRMREKAADYGIVFADNAPYEVLKTDAMSYDELRRLHRVEQVLDMLYNAGQARKTLELIVPAFGSPFAFFDAFTRYLEDAAYFSRPQKKQAIFEQLFACAKERVGTELLRETLGFDWLCGGKPNIWPDGICVKTLNLREFFTGNESEKLFENLPVRAVERRYVVAELRHLFEKPLIFDYSKSRDDDGFVQPIK